MNVLDTGPLSLDAYHVDTLCYARLPERRIPENFMMEPDLHGGPMPLDYNVCIIRNAYRTVLVDTGFGPQAGTERRRPLDLDPMEAELSDEEHGKMEIKRSGLQLSGKAPPEDFTGTVRVDPLFQTAASSPARGNCVSFERGARTAWHTHPLGQSTAMSYIAIGEQIEGKSAGRLEKVSDEQYYARSPAQIS